MKSTKIGITEQGDAGIDLSWKKALENKEVAGAILITKKITDEFIDAVLSVYQTTPVVVHCTVTGLGGSFWEPNVWSFRKQLDQLDKLIKRGFPESNVVIRIDPIIPVPEHLSVLKDLFEYIYSLNFENIRRRVSVYDEYPKVVKRLYGLNHKPVYENGKFQASKEQLKAIIEELSYDDHKYETCAEGELCRVAAEMGYGRKFVQNGCVSYDDLNLMGIDTDEDFFINPQQRSGCLCLSCKTELLHGRKRCPNKCTYCFWDD